MVPFSNASKINNIVMIFVTLAGGRAVSASFSNKTVPVDISIRIPDGALISTSSAWTTVVGNAILYSRKTPSRITVKPFFICNSPMDYSFTSIVAMERKYVWRELTFQFYRRILEVLSIFCDFRKMESNIRRSK